MKSNAITSLFGVKYPIIQGGMIWCSGWELASAVSNAGGLGLIGAGSMPIDVFRQHVDKCAAATDKPFGVNLSLQAKDLAAYVEYVVEKKVPIVFTSAGSPKLWTSKLQAKGIKVAHVIPSVKLALKCQDAGVDALVAEGFEAGGHNGFEEITTMTLIPQVRQAVKPGMPLLAAGGIGSGYAMAAAMALGADGVQVGTRFALTTESSCSDAFKQRCAKLHESETVLTMRSFMPTRLVLNDFGKEVKRICDAGGQKEEVFAFRPRGSTRKGMFEGDIVNGELEIGQIASACRDIVSSKDVVSRMVKEYNEVTQKLAAAPM